MLSYRFEGSSEVRTLDIDPSQKDEDLCDIILKSIFGNIAPPCNICVQARQNGLLIVKRNYAKKFESLEVKKTGPPPPPPYPPPRRRRWRSPPPGRPPRRKKRNRYKRVYTNRKYK
jgi:hypothetical protein